MQRIDTATRAQNLFGAGKDGFTEGAIGPPRVAATAMSAAWHNAVQEEIARVIEAYASELNPADNSQLVRVLRGFVEANWTEATPTGAALIPFDVYAACSLGPNGGAVIGGTNGYVQVSDDGSGSSWTTVPQQLADPVSGHPDITGLAYNVAGNMLVAVGKASGGSGKAALWWSNDKGITWVQNFYDVPEDINAIIYNAAFGWIAVGNDGLCIKAADPTGAWTSMGNISLGANLHALAYNAVTGTLLATADGAPAQVLTSVDNGVTWAPTPIPGAYDTLYAACAYGPLFLVAGSGGQMYSSAGWALLAGVGSTVRAMVCAPGGVILAVCDDASLYSSVDGGATWTRHYAARLPNSLYALAWLTAGSGIGFGWLAAGKNQTLLNSLRIGGV
jgi:photosystem II stability/assembly factor-like uncharacterized protein